LNLDLAVALGSLEFSEEYTEVVPEHHVLIIDSEVTHFLALDELRVFFGEYQPLAVEIK
jgi:hypothetical protein